MKALVKIFLIVVCILTASLSFAGLFWNTAKITIKVVDDDGKALEGIVVGAEFLHTSFLTSNPKK